MQPTVQRGPGAVDPDLERLRSDLGALRQAVGLEPPFGREEVWAHLVFAACGAVTVVWALLPTGFPAQWGAVPLVLCVVGYAAWMRWKYRRGTGRSPIRRREYTASVVAMVLVTAMAMIYRVWAQRLGVSLTVMGSAALFLFGLALLVLVLRERDRLSDLGIAVPLVASGLVIPFCSVSPWVVLGATFMAGGLATAALTAHRLRGIAADHVSD